MHKSNQREKRLETQVSKLQQDDKGLKNSLSKLEVKLRESKQKLNSFDSDIEKVRADQAEKLEIMNRKSEAASEQLAAMTQQLAEAVKQKKEAQDELKDFNTRSVNRKDLENAQKAEDDLKTQIKELRKENKYLRGQVDKARDILSKVKPGELKRLQNKATKMEQLYTSMKGLRELAEERNENWETV